MAKKAEPQKEFAVPQEHWQMKYNTCEPSENMKATQGSDFAPKKASDRKTTYVKINKEDH